MKKFAVIILITFIGLFIASCVWDSVHYCPYCARNNITETETKGVYKCNANDCGKTFGAKEIKQP